VNDLDQEDPALTDFVKTLIISPPDKSVPYNLPDEDQYLPMTGQWGQVEILFMNVFLSETLLFSAL
jgi:hypothetical protein